MKTYIKFNYTLLKGYSYTSKLLNSYNKYFSASSQFAYAKQEHFFLISNSLNNPAGYKKYYHNHPVSKLEKILKKMNEKKLILPTPRENIDSIFKANNLSKIEIDNILKIKRISHTTLPAYYTETKNAESLTDIESELNNTLVTAHTTRLPSLAGAHSERTCVASSLENKLNLSKVSFQFMPEQSEREILKQGETSKAISPYKSSDNIYTLSLGFKKNRAAKQTSRQ